MKTTLENVSKVYAQATAEEMDFIFMMENGGGTEEESIEYHQLISELIRRAKAQ